MKKIGFLLLSLQLLFSIIAFGQKNSSNEVVFINGKKFVTYTISKGETIFSVCKKFDCEQKELSAANPQLVDGLKEGSILNIPYKSTNKELKKIEEKIQKEEKAAEKKAIKAQKNSEQGFILHKVEHGETLYSLKKRYDVSDEELLKLNPELSSGLKDGMSIKIPTEKKPEKKPEKSTGYRKHVVDKGETMYRITTLYNVSVDDIKKLNPTINGTNLNEGDTLLIPTSNGDTERNSFGTKTTVITDVRNEDRSSLSEKPKKDAYKTGDVFQVTLFLPFYLDINDSLNQETLSLAEFARNDSLKKIDPTYNYDFIKAKDQRSLYTRSKNFVSFYEGFTLALDSFANAGMKIKLNVYDTRNGSAIVDSVIKNTNLANSDLIVGPIDTKYQKSISNYCYKNHIPLISPLDSDDDYVGNNPFYFQVNPTKDYVLRKTADFIGNEFYNKNFIILSLGGYDQLKESRLEDMVRAKFNAKKSPTGSVREVDFTAGGKQGYWQIKDDLKKDVENVVFIPAPNNRSEREALLSRAINSLYTLSADYDITLVGMNDYPNMKSINTDYFHRLKLHILSPNFIDFEDPDVVNFIQKFRNRFSSEPNQYSFRGYDVATYFTAAYRKFGSNYSEKVSSYHPKTLQSYFDFRRAKELSGYMNKSLFIINYTKDYETKVISKISN
jgi:LysM repeat protein/ABC-type branched-subunit amino acid transport system substrate-binding protein